jgi:hypothetical protein
MGLFGFIGEIVSLPVRVATVPLRAVERAVDPDGTIMGSAGSRSAKAVSRGVRTGGRSTDRALAALLLAMLDE